MTTPARERLKAMLYGFFTGLKLVVLYGLAGFVGVAVAGGLLLSALHYVVIPYWAIVWKAGIALYAIYGIYLIGNAARLKDFGEDRG